MNPLKGLQKYGQSAWLDYIHRNLIRSGDLTRLVEQDGVRGVTSNPTIFESAIAGCSDYDDALRDVLVSHKVELMRITEPLQHVGVAALAKSCDRLLDGGHRVVGYDRNPDAVAHVVEQGAPRADSLGALTRALTQPREICLLANAWEREG